MNSSEYQYLRENYAERTMQRISDLEPAIESLTESNRWSSIEIKNNLNTLIQKIEFWKLQVIEELNALKQMSQETWSWTFNIDDIEHLWVRIQTCLNQAFELTEFGDEFSHRSLALTEIASVY